LALVGGKDFNPLLVDDGVAAAVILRPGGDQLGEFLGEPVSFGGRKLDAGGVFKVEFMVGEFSKRVIKALFAQTRRIYIQGFQAG